ncbi:tetratricopeptide repeat protein [Tichowtungia aerotolerans]|uniref:Sel1 repeat family protein n=1 Tax=Tichowtungia aerotolerans TaxID=2697043 RepID=A0A6P1M3U7_9BACT|nr:tetratricopeptide repeat protein [Tichowtungia aerotolerans]QHI69280.1 hypothetical protein GT409_07395 [Tichowtungia aerotolerans]
MKRIKSLAIACMATMLALTSGCEKNSTAKPDTPAQEKPAELSEAEILQQKVDAGDAEAICRLGSLLLIGEGVDKNLEQGMQYIREAAELGVPFAQFAMGSAYMGVTYEGETLPCEIDIEKGVDWHKKAAEQGFEASQVALAKHYMELLIEDKGNPELIIQTYTWVSKAAHQGNDWAMEMLPAITQVMKLEGVSL